MKAIINTREDLDAIKDSDEYFEFMRVLKGSMARKQDVQIYPDDYNQPYYQGEKLTPIWETVEDLSMIQRFGFDKSDFDDIL